MTVRFDAYTATMKGPKPDDLFQLLFDQVGISGKFNQTKGFHQFGERLSAKFADGSEAGAVSWGGKQGDLVMIEVKGEASTPVVTALRERFQHRVTRVDSCADFDAPKAFESLYRACRQVKKAHRILGGKAGDWEDFPEKGRTLYLGSKSSPNRCRLYEKGLQVENLHLNRPNWARLELQIRPKSPDAGYHFAHLTPLEVWGAGRWSRDLAAAVLKEHVDPHPSGSTYRLSETEAALRWMCKQYGKHLVSLAEETGSWECLGLTLREILLEQKKGR